MSYKRLDKDAFTELIAELIGPYTEEGAWSTMREIVAVLSVGGGVGVYVTVPAPQEPSVPTNRGFYSIGFTRAVPLPGRHTVHVEHQHDVFTGTRKDETSHLIAHYQGEPVYYEDVHQMIAGHDEFVTGEMRGNWFLDAFGPLPPAEIFQRGLTKLDGDRYTNYLFGPAYQLYSATLCDHDYHLTDSCPGCDADKERRTGVYAGVDESELV